MKWIRTCQSCGYKQECPMPTFINKTVDGLTDAYCNRKCKKCRSESLDYGSEQPSTSAEIEAYRKAME